MLRKWSDSCALIIPVSEQPPPPDLFTVIRSALNSASLQGLSPTFTPKLQDEASGDTCHIFERCWYLGIGTGLCHHDLRRIQLSSLLHWVHQAAGLKHDSPLYNKVRETGLYCTYFVLGGLYLNLIIRSTVKSDGLHSYICIHSNIFPQNPFLA